MQRTGAVENIAALEVETEPTLGGNGDLCNLATAVAGSAKLSAPLGGADEPVIQQAVLGERKGQAGSANETGFEEIPVAEQQWPPIVEALSIQARMLQRERDALRTKCSGLALLCILLAGWGLTVTIVLFCN